MDNKSLSPMSEKSKKLFVLFDSSTTETEATFVENWDSQKEVVILTAAKDNLVSLENDSTLTNLNNVVYIGNQKEVHERIVENNGISFTSDEFLNLNKEIIQTCSSINIKRINIKAHSKLPTRRTIFKIKKICKLGLYLKQYQNVL